MFRRFSLLNQRPTREYRLQCMVTSMIYIFSEQRVNSITWLGQRKLDIRRQENCDAGIRVINLYSLSTITQQLRMYCIISMLETVYRETSFITPVLILLFCIVNFPRAENCDAGIRVITLYSLSAIIQSDFCLYCIISILETVYRKKIAHYFSFNLVTESFVTLTFHVLQKRQKKES